jgi:hypothetical protein
VTTSEREGLKQVEKAINLMLDIVNFVGGNHAMQLNLIRGLEANIVKYRKRLGEIDSIASRRPDSRGRPGACAQPTIPPRNAATDGRFILALHPIRADKLARALAALSGTPPTSGCTRFIRRL